MTAFHTNPSLIGFAALDEEENKIICEWHEVLRGGRATGRKTPREKKRGSPKNKKTQK